MTEEHCPTCRRPLPPDAPGGLCPVCVLLGARGEAVPTDLPAIDEIRAALPQFEILECIGRGGMGVVYKARQPQLDRLVALKILLPGLEHDPGFAERFSREARALAKLSHPNIVAVHDFGESGGYFWLTMEYVDGVNLRQAMQAARFTPAQALALIPELCAALQYAHDRGVLHRDIKPENILLDTKGRVKVADFGIARMAGDERMDFTLTRTGSVLGSAAYVAPEQIERPHEVDHRADLYSLGVVLYEMLTGELPLGRFPAPSERSASDPRLDEVVFRTLEKEREKRFQSADDLKTGVSGFDRDPGGDQATGRQELKLEETVTPTVKVLPAAPPARLLPMTIGLLLAGGTLLGIAAAAESLLIAAPGACAMVLGFAAGWWALWRMKMGVLPLTGRVLLMLLLVWLPLLGGSATLAFLAADDFAPWFGAKGDYLAKMAFVFTASFLPAAGLLHLAALKTGETRRRRTNAIVAVVLAVAALAGGKCLDGRWPVANFRETVYVKTKRADLWKRQAPLIEDALRQAAGPYADRMEIAAGEDPLSNRPAIRVRFLAADRDHWDAHWRAMATRLAAVLPPECYVALDWNQLDFDTDQPRQEPDNRFRHFVISSGIFLATALSALLAASALFPASWTPVLVFLGGAAAMALAPPLARNSLVDGDPLPPLRAAVLPADFSTPVTAARSVLDAAHAGDLETVKRGMSRRNRTFLDNRDGWEIAMENLGQRAVVSASQRSRPFPNRCPILREMRDGVRTHDMLFEDGEWRLDELPFDVPEPPEAAAISSSSVPSGSPQHAVEALLAAARDQDEESFLAGMSRSLAAEVRRESKGGGFPGDLARVAVVRARQLDGTTANVIVRAIDDPAREVAFRMVLEDGRWKLDKISR